MWAGLRGCGKDVIVPGQVFGELGPQGHVADSLSWGSFELAPFQPHVRACVCVCVCVAGRSPGQAGPLWYSSGAPPRPLSNRVATFSVSPGQELNKHLQN